MGELPFVCYSPSFIIVVTFFLFSIDRFSFVLEKILQIL